MATNRISPSVAVLLLATVAVFLSERSAVAQSIPRPVMLPVPGHPFGVVATADDKWIFVSLMGGRQNLPGALAIFQNQNGYISLHHILPMRNIPLGMALTHDGGLLVVTAQDLRGDGYVIFFDTDRLITGRGNPRHLIAPGVAYLSEGEGSGSIYANITSDDKTLFVSNERSHSISVIDLASIREGGLAAAARPGTIEVGGSPVALTFSKDEHLLFTTSEIAAPSWHWPRILSPEGGNRGRVPEGAVIVIDVSKAKTDPQSSVVARVPAGGSPVRLALSEDGGSLYVTARHSDAVLVFDTEKLASDSQHVRPKVVRVGSSPVPIAALKNGNFVLVGNSNRYTPQANDPSTLMILDTRRIDAGVEPIVGTIPAGAYPRELFLSADGRRAYLTNYLSDTLEVITLAPVR